MIRSSCVSLVLFLAALASGCGFHGSTSPSALNGAEESVRLTTSYPSTGPDVIAYVAARHPDRLAAGVSGEERRRNMEFLRDRIVEVGQCGGMDLGYNLKRGGPELSVDVIAWRTGGEDIGVDIAFDYDGTDRPLQLMWSIYGPGASYRAVPKTSCR